MPQILAYIRTSTDKQDNDNQKLEIYEYARNKKMKIDEVIQIQISSHKGRLQRRIEELMEKLHEGDTLIVTEISRLGRSTAEVIHLINSMIKNSIRIISIKQGIDINEHDMSSKIIITIFSLLAELERDLISLRTKEALSAKKAKGIRLGKPVGTIQKSKFDKDVERIKELLSLGVSIRRSSKILGYPNHTPNMVKFRFSFHHVLSKFFSLRPSPFSF
jgi:DNA invertase Pin-like site-specific DNA recombinase